MAQKGKTFILNVGLGRCGTTTLAKYFFADSRINTSEPIKELQYFLASTVRRDSYINQLCAKGSEDYYFESSPQYCNKGIETFVSSIDRFHSILQRDDRVRIVFSLRNLLNRAFSQYWHKISSRFALFGTTEVLNNKRYSKLYQASFFQSLNFSSNYNRVYPEVGKMILYAIEKFGKKNVCIIHTPSLDEGLGHLFQGLNLGSNPKIPLKRHNAGRAPVFVYSGDSNTVAQVFTANGTALVKIPKQKCLLFSRSHSEVLSGDEWDLEALVASSLTWSRSIDTRVLPFKFLNYLGDQMAQLAKVPESCFLGTSRAECIQEVTTLPEEIEIPDVLPVFDDLKQMKGVQILSFMPTIGPLPKSVMLQQRPQT